MRGVLAAVMWAVFLGCSWTWVIGMFLPVLLVRDYGLWGWVAFAVPNVLGAAAMGFVLKNPGASQRLVQQHGPACRWFSLVTVAYQAYLIGALAGPAGLSATGMIVLIILFLGRLQQTRDVIAALIVFAISVGLFLYAQMTGELWQHLDPNTYPGRLSRMDLWMFIPAAAFGFVLCPYLDLTFHRARQATTPGTGRAAFTLGFGVFFLSMIVFSLAYAGALENVTGHIGMDLAPKLWPAVLVQLIVQGGFTVAVHLRSLTVNRSRGTKFAMVAAVAIGLMLGLGALLLDGEPGPWIRWQFVTSVTELGYRAILLLYGTAFPAYVLICMTPTYRQLSHKFRLLLFVLAASLSYPLACVAFIANRSLWAIPILVIMLAARVVVEMLPGTNDSDEN
ncbi:MAG: hypothetical protein Kow00105_16190 [Phycisphaeraceae bacterium]